ncbi:MAG: NAD(P)H-binding protein [Deltaproteobacteria bacterium]|nr:NAD(P)H-binding protein [Deltaproteobacteria bacterium]
MSGFTIRRPLVIGGHGFIGTHVVRALLGRGLPVRVAQRPKRVPFHVRDLPVTTVKLELGDREALARAIDGCDTVFFAAGHYPRFSLDLDREVAAARLGARAAVEGALAAGVERFVLTSSVATIGPSADGGLARERDEWPSPPDGSVYHAVKLAIEDEVRAGIARGLLAVVLCPTGCVGEHDAKVGTGFFLIGVARGIMPHFVDGPTNMVDVAEVGRAHVRAAELGEVGERYILGGPNITVRELLETSARVLGVRLRASAIPMEAALELATADEVEASRTGGPRKAMPREFVDIVRHGHPVDSWLATCKLGLGPTNVAAVLDRAVTWYEDHRYIPRRRSAGQVVEER